MRWLRNLFKRKAPQLSVQPPYEVPSPLIRIKPEQVETLVEEDGSVSFKVKGFLPGSHVITVAPTNSLDPFIDDGMLVILEPYTGQELVIGDIIDYALPFSINGFSGGFHRIISIGQDAQGWWCRTKGDNPASGVDPVLVRKENIRRLYRGVLV